MRLARSLADLRLPADLGKYVLDSLGTLATWEPELLSQVAGKPWFRDGLDQEEAAFVATLGWQAREDNALFNALLREHHTQSKTISLSLAGDVNVWVVQSLPFSEEDNILEVIESNVYTIEGFVGLALPTTDVIFLVNHVFEDDTSMSDGISSGYFHGEHYGNFIKISRSSPHVPEEWKRIVIPHELAHYYIVGRPWLNEGFAHLMEGFVGHSADTQTMDQRRVEASERVEHRCGPQGITTIRHALFMDTFTITPPSQCTRALGLSFLHEALKVVGEESLGAAVRELHTLARPSNGLDSGEEPLGEETIYQTLYRLAPPDTRDRFRSLYRRLHGGPYADPDLDRSDDHGDSVETATDVTLGQTMGAALDYEYDFDYFRFQAEEGQKYRFTVNHRTLPASSVMMFSSAAKRQLPKSRVRSSSGPVVQWVAPSTDSYFFAVLNFKNDAGPYTFDITLVPDVPDDHGDTVATATDILPGEPVRGVIDDDFDLDYFRLNVIAGERYAVRIGASSLLDCCVDLFRSASGLGEGSSSFGMVVSATGEEYLVVHGGPGNTGSYTLEVLSD